MHFTEIDVELCFRVYTQKGEDGTVSEEEEEEGEKNSSSDVCDGRRGGK